MSGRIVAGIFERSDDPLYPPAALREALANALAHRDYMAGGGSVSLAIYDDRLDVVSVGPLPFGQRPEDLVEPHTSRPWNPSIAHVMYLRGLMETWGRGVGKMRELAARAGLDPPEILATRDEVTVRFRQRSGLPAQAAVEELSGLQQEILHLVEEHGSLSLPKLGGLLTHKVSQRTLRGKAAQLIQLGLLRRVGQGKSTRYAR